MVFLMLAGVVVVTASSPKSSLPTPVVPVAEAPDAASAFAAARLQGTPVGVADQTAEAKKVLANPDGTLTAQLSPQPVRVRKRDGWVPVDTALASVSDGTVRPKAAVADVAFSAGGAEGPLVRFSRDGKRLALRWPGVLPKPELDGSTARYREVLPGVDLEMQAEAEGYNQRFVVKTPEAGRNPALASIKLALETEGVQLMSDGTGRVQAVDGAGQKVFVAPAAIMWDARGRESTSTPVDVAVDSSTMTLKPNAAMLTAPSTRYPVVVDPDMRSPGQSMWAKVFRGHPDMPYVNGTGDGDAWAKVGKCTWAQCRDIDLARTFFQFDTGFLAGKLIKTVNFNTAVVHGPDCGANEHKLFIADRNLDWGVTWNNQPGGQEVSTSWVPGSWDSCPGNQPAGFGVGLYVNPNGPSTYFLQAKSESDSDAWRRYDVPSTILQITYNTRPNPPYDMKTDPPLRAPCRWCDGVPYVGDPSIRLLSRLSDPDGNDQLRPVWDIYGGAPDQRAPATYQASGAYHSTDVDLTKRNGQRVSWTMWGHDSADGGDWRNGPGPFIVDRTGIGNEPTVTASLYKADNAWHGGVGVPDVFEFDASDATTTVTDVDHYLYGWADPPTTKVDAVALGGKAYVKLTPPGDGPRDLYVRSVDRAGNPSPVQTHHFYVRAGNGPLGQWSLEGNTKDTATLGFRDATLHGGTVYVPGSTGSGIKLDGVDDYMTAPISAGTYPSFSFSGWVNLAEKKPGWSTLLSQNASTTAMVKLGHTGTATDRWALEFRPGNDPGTAPTTVSSLSQAQANTWTHLAGVYDSGAQQIRLYVNGDLQGSTTWTAPWPATHEFAVGRAIVNSAGSDYLAGAVDEIRTYDRVLTDAEVKSAVTRDNVTAGYWNLDDADGTTARNAAAGGEMAVLQPGARFAPQGAVNGAATFDGVKGYAATSGPVVRTDQSYAITAWVKPDKLGDMTAVSQDGTAVSGFYLKQINGSWVFGMNPGDATGGTAAEAKSAANTVQTVPWTHLAGVYNATAKTLTLVVNGKQVASVSAPAAPWHSAGPFAIGRGKYGTPLGYWAGGIDEVRAYSRTLDLAEIQGIVAQNNVTAATWKLDGDAQDTSGMAKHASAKNGAQWIAGQTSYPDQTDLAVKLDGVDDHVSAPSPVDSSMSFSVAAWVKMTTKTPGWGAVLSQSGQNVSAFNIGYTGTADDRWAFAMHGPDSTAPTAVVRARSAQPVQTGVWTHLVANYDSNTGEMQLYVNGTLSGTATFTARWNATTEFDIGRGKWAGNWLDHFGGAVDDVKVYSRTLFTDEIRTMSGQDLTLVHNWQLDESGGIKVSDSTGARTGTLEPGTQFAPGRVGNAVQFDGKTGAIGTTGVDLRTDESFSVSAWVYMDRRSDIVSKLTALSVDGERTSKFRLGHVADEMNATCFGGEFENPNACGKWVFEMAETDTDTTVARAAVPAFPAEMNSWVHLAGTYDRQTKKTWLYVNGKRVGDATLNGRWQASGGAQIGRGLTADKPSQFWTGRVDDVRVYTTALDKDRVSGLYKSYPAGDGGTATLPVADAGHWRFDENAGQVALDASGRGLTVALKDSAGWGGGMNTPGLRLDGATGYAQTSGPVLDTAKSFSTAAWVQLTKTDGGYYSVFGQDGNRVSAFLVQYDGGAKKWRVVVPSEDKDNPPAVALWASQAPQAHQWVHLAVVYDAQFRQLRLYVDGVQSAAQVGVTTIPSAGAFSIGRARWNGGNAGFFPQGIDDMRAFSRALTDAEVRKVHDDIPRGDGGAWRFDNGTGKDYSWRGNTVVPAGGASFVPGVSGTALKLNGTDGQATAPERGLAMQDSFTVSAWANLARTDQVATVMSQDGARMSGFALQYRPEAGRWTFGATAQDVDVSPVSYVSSFDPAVVNRWTHLTGIYDQAAHQLRLYVDGQFAGKKDGVVLWQANGSFVIGRGKTNGKAAEFFPGMIDEVYAHYGMASEAAIRTYGSFPAPDGGQLGSYVDAAGRKRTASTNAAPAAGYRFEESLGMLIDSAQPHTRVLYSCQSGTDFFTSTDAACEGKTKISEIGSVYTQQPTNIPTIPVYRCTSAAGHFDSRQADCGGATQEALLGYTLAYAPLVRYYNNAAYDHLSTTQAARPGYYAEFRHGYLPLLPQTGTQPLTACVNDADQFVSLDTNCEGKNVIGPLGQLWTQPPDGPDVQMLYRCGSSSVESMTNTSDNCGAMGNDRLLGYVITKLPQVEPVFAAASSGSTVGREPAPPTGTGGG
ncbi:LamG domain-containing protein [Amycolatopsis sp. lyj-108]|uniref:LamG domain-containing protein n=1 Tax=Amycolatopsis sp. lyj-108 TaxID=2789286 RepID=UPI00397CD621